jgi:DNA-binding transcriptional LysR family regulator
LLRSGSAPSSSNPDPGVRKWGDAQPRPGPDAVGNDPKLEKPCRAVLKIALAASDSRSGRQYLDLAGLRPHLIAQFVLMRDRAFVHIGDDLHVAMPAHGMPRARPDHIVIPYAQAAPVHATGIAIVRETEMMAAFHPAERFSAQPRQGSRLDHCRASSSSRPALGKATSVDEAVIELVSSPKNLHNIDLIILKVRQMASPGTPTLEQLRVFLTVVESGSFAAAGRRLNRAASAISYSIGNLERQFGVTLFERSGTRRPLLTPAGRAVQIEARNIEQEIDGLRAKVKGLLDGLEAEVDLAVDVMLPVERLGRILEAFAHRFPTVTLRLHVEALGAITAMVLDGVAGVGISGPLASGVGGIECIPAGSVPMIPVASPRHPLGRMKRIPSGTARQHIQLVLTDRSRFTEGQDFSVTSSRTWRLADLGSKHAFLRQGIGWGNMPLPAIQSDLDEGRLVRLAIPDHPGGTYRFNAIWRRDLPPGPAAIWLTDQFVVAGALDEEVEGFRDL